MQAGTEGHESCCAVWWVRVDIDRCATESGSSIVGCSKKNSIWIWSIHLSGFVIVQHVFPFAQEKKKLQCLKGGWKQQCQAEGPALGSSFDRVMKLRLYPWQKHAVVEKYMFFYLSGCPRKQKESNQPTSDLLVSNVMKESAMQPSWEYLWRSKREALSTIWLQFLKGKHCNSYKSLSSLIVLRLSEAENPVQPGFWETKSLHCVLRRLFMKLKDKDAAVCLINEQIIISPLHNRPI